MTDLAGGTCPVEAPGPPAGEAADRVGALYVGEVRHQRLVPRPRSFRYSVVYWLVDLAAVDEALARHPAWGRSRWAPVRWRRADHFGDPDRDLGEEVRDLVAQRTGHRPTGRIVLLTQPRMWGWLFNPISIFYCFDDHDRLDAVVAEVTNTPWKERHCYVVRPDADGRADGIDKRLHVSPFWDMDHRYRFSVAAPGPQLHVGIDNEREGRIVFRAAVDARRLPLDRSSMTRVLLRHPLQTVKVSAAIHWQAARLLLARVPVRRHPSRDPRRRADRCPETAP